MPGAPIPTKTFTVTNKGNGKVENYKVYLESVQNQLELKDDLKYTLTCKQYQTTDTTVDFSTLTSTDCNGASSTTFPSVMSEIATNTIDVGYTHYYELKVEYLYQQYDQSVDMNKLVQAKVNIYDGKTKFLATEIMSNVKSNETVDYNKTLFIEPSEQDGITYTIPAEPINSSTERIMTYTIDDLGTSYYYRGNVEDNYVNFAGMCWRIVRIEGDGSTKLLLEDRYAECNDAVDNDGTGTTDYAYTGNWSDGSSYKFGYDSNNRAALINYSGGLADSFKTFQTSKLTSTDLQKLKVDEWCYDDNVTSTDDYGDEYYGAYTRIETNKKPSLSCSGTKITKFNDENETDMYVGTLTADEMSFAGTCNSTNYNCYLMNTYAKDNFLYWWSLSPVIFYEEYGYGTAFFLSSNGYLDYRSVRDDYYSRPAVSLVSTVSVTTKTDTETTGQPGTINNPYVIN